MNISPLLKTSYPRLWQAIHPLDVISNNSSMRQIKFLISLQTIFQNFNPHTQKHHKFVTRLVVYSQAAVVFHKKVRDRRCGQPLIGFQHFC